MPSRRVHIGKAKSFIRSIRVLLRCETRETLLDPLATLAYYAAMHCFEACFDEGVGAPRGTHCKDHDKRIETALRAKPTLGSKPVNSLKTLYEFSRIARYAQDKRRSPGSEKQVEKKKEPHLGQDPKTLDEVMRRLERCVKKVRELLVVSEDELPCLAWANELQKAEATIQA